MRRQWGVCVLLACLFCGLTIGCGGGDKVSYPPAQTVDGAPKDKEITKTAPKQRETN